KVTSKINRPELQHGTEPRAVASGINTLLFRAQIHLLPNRSSGIARRDSLSRSLPLAVLSLRLFIDRLLVQSLSNEIEWQVSQSTPVIDERDMFHSANIALMSA